MWANHVSSQGFDAEHRDIDLLRLRNYTIGKKLSDDEVIDAQFLTRLGVLLTALQPFVSLLHLRIAR